MPYDALPVLFGRRARRDDVVHSPMAARLARCLTAAVASGRAALLPILVSVGARGVDAVEPGRDAEEPGRDAEPDAADHVALFSVLPWV